MSSKQRVYEVARDLGMDNKSLVGLFHSVGITEVKNHMSAVAPEQVERIRRHLAKDSPEKVEEQRIRPTVVKRRGRPSTTREASSPEASPAPPPRPSSSPTVIRRAPAAGRPSAPPAPAVAAGRAPPRPEPPQEPVRAASLRPQAEEPLAVERTAQSAPPASKAAPPSSPQGASAAASPSEVVSARDEAPSAPAAPSISEPEPPAPAPQTVAPAAKPPAARAPSPPIAARAAPSAAAALAPAVEGERRPSSPPRTGIDVWEGRPGVPMPQSPRSVGPRRVQYDTKPTTANARRSGPVAAGRGVRGPRRGIGSLTPRRSSSATPATRERSARKKIVKIESTIGLQSLAAEMGTKAGQLLMKLMSMGMTGININSALDPDTAKIIANEFGWEVEDVAVSEEEQINAAQGAQEQDLVKPLPRPPVVTVMGHVDHGKTSLLDQIRKTKVASGEAGGITQHIGAYVASTPRGPVTFLDTPGHAAFTAMRARGAQTTDIVILVVAADDGVKPQTREAVDHAKAAKCPIVVAVNKCDKEDAQPERVRRELSELGLVPEEWGGDTLFCEVSALTGEGIDKLLENIGLQAEVMELSADPSVPAQGVVLEAKLDRGRGPIATLLVKEGTLNRGDVVLAGTAFGKVRAMLDDLGTELAQAGPSVPVAIVGLNEVPRAGDNVYYIKDLKTAQQLAEERRRKERGSLAASGNLRSVSLEELAKRMSDESRLELKVVIKADVQGSVEALRAALEELSTEKVGVTVVTAGVGGITESDVNLAVAAKAIVIGFNTRPAGKARLIAQREGVEIRQYSVIYDAIDEVRSAMEGLLAPKLVEREIGQAEIRKVFRISRAGTVAGCMVVGGLIRRNGGIRILREGELVFDGKLDSLKRFKDDAKEVREGFDCGMSFSGFNDIQEGDVVHAFEVEEVRQSLE